MADLQAFVTAWYWSGADLRECIVVETTVLGCVTRAVIDLESGEPVNVDPVDVFVQTPT